MTHFRNFLLNSASWMLCFLPLALLTGPFIPDLIVVLLSLIFLFLVIKDKLWSYFTNYFVYFFLFFYFYLLVRSSFSINPLFSLENSLFYFRFLLLSLCVWLVIDSDSKFLRRFSIIFALTFSIALSDGFYQYLNGKNIFGFSGIGTRLTLVFNDSQILGGYLSRLFPLLIGLLIFNFNPTKIKIIFTIVLLILTDVLIFVSGERTALGLLFISTLFIVLLISKFKTIRIISFIVSILIMTMITIYNPSVKERNISVTMNDVGLSVSSDRVYLFSQVHEKYILTAWNMFKDKPLIGHGPKLFRELCSRNEFQHAPDSCTTHPHNTYIQLLAETGIIGFLFILITVLYLCRVVIKHIYESLFRKNKVLSDYQICLIACFIISLWPFLPTQNFFNNYINIIYFLPVGFYLQSIYKKDS
tara:strand:- start:6620 stop:7867 length:1248 start_codon:yes stop_codon:yes gene_type:complete